MSGEGAGAPRSARALRFLLVSGLLAAATAVGGLFYLQARLARGLAAYLRREVFPDPALASFSDVGVDLLRGRVSLKGLRVKSSPEGPARALAVNEVSLEAKILPTLLSGAAPRLSLVRLEEPSLDVHYGGGSPDAPAGEKDPLLWLKRLPIERVEARRSFLRLRHAAGGKALELDAVDLDVVRAAGGRGFSARGKGVFGEASAGTFSFRVSLPEGSPCPSEGELQVDGLSVPLLATYFPGAASVSFIDGRSSLKTQFTCKDGWLTASHLVELEGLRAEVPEGAKEVFGIPVKYFQQLLRIDRLSFVVPMNGSLSDPHIGVASSVQQILLKVLASTTKDARQASELARKGGDYFGRKVDRELKARLGRP